MVNKIPDAGDFQNELYKIFRENEGNGKAFVDVRAGDLHTKTGYYPSPSHRMPTCCSVMKNNINEDLGDTELPGGPLKGVGANLVIRYKLPRTPFHLQSFTTKCAYCNGTGKAQGGIDFVLGKDCMKCKGTGKRTIPGSETDYVKCNCDGTGKDKNSIDPWKPCHICDGIGIVKK